MVLFNVCYRLLQLLPTLSLLPSSLLLFTLPYHCTTALTANAAQVTRSRLAEAFASPSGKLTLSPEIIIEDPINPTAILLQSSAVSSLSETLRTKAKANSAFVSCTSLSSLKTFCNEQEEARGNFPGPIPVIYCHPKKPSELETNDDATVPTVDLKELAETGASGILVSTTNEIASLEDILSDNAWIRQCQEALESGLQPIPEILVTDTIATTWKENDVEALVTKIAEATGQDPVTVLLTIQTATSSDGNANNSDSSVEILPLPTVPRSLGRKIPILGSVRTPAGENRLGEETARWKAAGFTGALLRHECLPGYQNKPSLEYVSDFWAACIGDLKSTRSKSFNFRSRNLMEKSFPLEWAKYQKSVIESGALGEAEDNSEGGFNPNSGDYKGF
ncbi:hypothetical protein IV203_024304 [Nitzschia inconspicua]|uniref:Aldolase n=1 Tax=Nitzschia inconspicua TaxID=303405 RepID=A0A9K3KCD3_9STRA|nr:hypothetical protein IV203_024304 [Nitzschia inconspicua]